MAKDIQTRFQLLFEGKGAEELQKKVERLAGAVSPEKMSSGFQKMDHWMKQNERQLQGMERHFKNLNKSLHQFGESVSKINNMAGALDKVKESAKEAGKEAQKSGAFLQGLFQGAGIGEYLPRGPGMGRQVAGRMIGGGARRMAGGARSAAGMVTGGGVGAMAGALSSIPGIGSTMGAMLTGAMGDVNSFRGFQQSQMGLAPFMDVGAAGARSSAAAAARAGIMGQDTSKFGPSAAKVLSRDYYAAPTQTADSLELSGRAGSLSGVIAPGIMGEDGQLDGGGYTAAQKKAAASIANKEATAAQRAAADKAAAVARGSGPMAGLGKAGVELGGLSRTQMNQFTGRVMGVAGGNVGQMRGSEGGGDLVTAALAAQTAYGVGPESTAAFGLGGRRGGLGGAQGSGAEAFGRVMEQAVASGMDATEVRRFIQETASGIESFRTTGIPMAPETVLQLGTTLANSGLQQGRANFMGSQMAGRAQQVGMKGPQSASDFLMLQKVGGFQGGGLEELENAQQKMLDLKKGGGTTEGFSDYLRTISEGAGGGAAGRLAVRGSLSKMNVDLGPDESKALQAQLEGRDVPDEFKGILEKTMRERKNADAPKGLKGLEAQAREAMTILGSSLKSQAALENTRIGIGAKLWTSMDDLEEATTIAHTAVTAFAPVISDLTTAAKDFAKVLPEISKWLMKETDGVEVD